MTNLLQTMLAKSSVFRDLNVDQTAFASKRLADSLIKAENDSPVSVEDAKAEFESIIQEAKQL